MFGTLRSIPSGNETYMVQATSPPFKTGRDTQPSRLACVACRMKKLKCTGERAGCQRCLTKDIACQYTVHRTRDRGPSNVKRPAPRNTSNNQRSAEQSSQKAGADELAEPVPECATSPSHSTRSGPMETGSITDFNLDQDLLQSSAFLMDCDQGELNEEESLAQFVESSKLTHDESWVFDLNKDLWSAQLSSMFDSDTSRQLPSFLSETLVAPLKETQAIQEAGTHLANSNLADFTISNGSTTTMNEEPRPLPDQPFCQCIPCALNIYEKLMINSYTRASDSVWSVNEVLYSLKIATAQCLNMMDCPSCSTNSPLISLIASVCEKLILQFEKVINSYADCSPVESSGSSNASSDTRLRRMSGINLKFSKDNTACSSSSSNYGVTNITELKIDGDDEIKVVKVLLMSRINLVDQLLQRMLKTVTGNAEAWVGYKEMLERIGVKLHSVAADLSRI
ncbi:hypothetical protein B7463_g8848, partial [Scytalidium lignicola]